MIELLALTILCGLATWRLASLLHTEDAFRWLREWIGIPHDVEGYPVGSSGTVLGDIFDCFLCLSLVASLPIVVLAAIIARVEWIWFPVLWMAASTVAWIVEKQTMRSHSR